VRRWWVGWHGQAKSFDGYFKLRYSKRITLATEVLNKDFCVLLHGRRFVVLASSTRVEQGSDESAESTLHTLPTMHSMSLHLVRARCPCVPPESKFVRFATFHRGTSPLTPTALSS
jgi:hypothetical protein